MSDTRLAGGAGGGLGFLGRFGGGVVDADFERDRFLVVVLFDAAAARFLLVLEDRRVDTSFSSVLSTPRPVIASSAH